jgi:rhodanese-related sulfurtransferase
MEQQFVCPPCGCNSDDKKFDKVGKCPSCGMNMVGEIDPSDGYAYSNVYPDDVCALDKEKWIFLDVRTKGEYNGELGHLKDAIHIHVEELEDRIEELEKYKDKDILVYCLISIRSMRASQILVDQGFTSVTNMLGGMDMWNDMDPGKLTCKESGRVIE